MKTYDVSITRITFSEKYSLEVQAVSEHMARRKAFEHFSELQGSSDGAKPTEVLLVNNHQDSYEVTPRKEPGPGPDST